MLVKCESGDPDCERECEHYKEHEYSEACNKRCMNKGEVRCKRIKNPLIDGWEE